MTTSLLIPSRRRARSAALALIVALAAGTAVAVVPAATASATDWPSWDDVQAAKASASAQQAKVTEITGLIAKLEADADAKQKTADAAGQAYQDAQTKYDQKTLEHQTLQTQADAADQTAARSESQAGQLAAQLGRSSNDNVTTNLLSHPSSAKDLLYELGAMSKLTEQADGIYAQASQDRGTAQALADKADVAKEALGALAASAQEKMQAAQVAAAVANTAVDTQNDNQDRLEAQLTLLTTNAKNVEDGYEKGVAEAKAKAAAAAKAAAEAARKAALAAPAAVAASTTPNASGWVRPTWGYQTSPFGYRVDPYTHLRALHAGVDLAPSCGAAIVAAASGTVQFAANGGGYGNEVIIDNGGGVSTAYGHIVNGGFRVSAGQHVDAGQLIALVGSTGWSTGCHLHFETRVNGAAVDPVPFMAARGISV